MTVPALTIADAVVAHLNGQAFGMDVTFGRAYVPKFDTAAAGTTPTGLIVPKSETIEASTAAADSRTIVVDIGVMKRLRESVAGESTEIDALMGLVEEIKLALNRERLDGYPNAVCIGIAQEPLYDVEQLDGRVFLAVVTATFLAEVAA